MPPQRVSEFFLFFVHLWLPLSLRNPRDDFEHHLYTLQVKIFEEDFQKERRDRERMNEEKEDLRRQVERLQGQMTNLTNQVSGTRFIMTCLAF